MQYAPRAVAPPPDVREAWQFFTDLALAMRVPMFGRQGVNGFINLTRLAARVTGRSALAFNPRWVSRILVASGRRIRWGDIMAHPHGWIFAEKEFGHFHRSLKTSDRRVHAAPPDFIAEARRRLAASAPQPPSGYPFALVSKRHKDTMNSWLGDLPGIRSDTRSNDVEINPDDAGRLGVKTGDLVRIASPSASIDLPATVSDSVAPGVVVVEQGWGTAVFDPTGQEPPDRQGANRNALVSDTELDPLSQVPALNSQPVSIERVP